MAKTTSPPDPQRTNGGASAAESLGGSESKLRGSQTAANSRAVNSVVGVVVFARLYTTTNRQALVFAWLFIITYASSLRILDALEGYSIGTDEILRSLSTIVVLGSIVLAIDFASIVWRYGFLSFWQDQNSRGPNLALVLFLSILAVGMYDEATRIAHMSDPTLIAATVLIGSILTFLTYWVMILVVGSILTSPQGFIRYAEGALRTPSAATHAATRARAAQAIAAARDLTGRRVAVFPSHAVALADALIAYDILAAEVAWATDKAGIDEVRKRLRAAMTFDARRPSRAYATMQEIVSTSPLPKSVVSRIMGAGSGSAPVDEGGDALRWAVIGIASALTAFLTAILSSAVKWP